MNDPFGHSVRLWSSTNNRYNLQWLNSVSTYVQKQWFLSVSLSTTERGPVLNPGLHPAILSRRCLVWFILQTYPWFELPSLVPRTSLTVPRTLVSTWYSLILSHVNIHKGSAKHLCYHYVRELKYSSEKTRQICINFIFLSDPGHWCFSVYLLRKLGLSLWQIRLEGGEHQGQDVLRPWSLLPATILFSYLKQKQN